MLTANIVSHRWSLRTEKMSWCCFAHLVWLTRWLAAEENRWPWCQIKNLSLDLLAHSVDLRLTVTNFGLYVPAGTAGALFSVYQLAYFLPLALGGLQLLTAEGADVAAWRFFCWKVANHCLLIKDQTWFQMVPFLRCHGRCSSYLPLVLIMLSFLATNSWNE